MPQILANNVAGVLSAGISALDTSVTLASAMAFPAPGADYYLATLIGLNGNGQEASWEIVKVTAKASNTLTIVRAQEGTTAATWPSATRIEMRLTAGSVPTLDEFTAHVGAGGAAHANATTGAAGFMSAADKSKLDGVAPGATANTGTVTSVGLSMPGQFSVASSPVTGAGTMTVSWASQAANLVFASPSGSSGAPGFRGLVAADIPTLNQNTTGTAANVTGVVGATNGGTGQSTWATGDLLYASAANTLAKLAGNTVAAKRFLTQTGTGAVSAAPAWGTIALTDLPTVTVAYGGLGLTSIAAKSIPVANSANTYTTVTPGAGQSVRINAGNTAWEAFTPGDVVLGSANTLTGANTFANASGQLFLASGTTTQDGIIINGRAGGTGSFRVTMAPTTLSASRAVTLPDAAGTMVLDTATQTLINKTLQSPTIYGDYVESVVTANTGTAYTIAINTATLQILTLTGNCTFTFPTPTAGKSFTLFLKQDATGSRTATWPASVKWPGNTAPNITSTASKMDVFIFTADGTNWIGRNGGQAYL